MKKSLLFISAIIMLLNPTLSAQTADERIGNAMNNADWFELEKQYNSLPKDSISPFLEVFSRALIGNRLNRPDVSIPAFGELLADYSDYLGVDNAVSSSMMYAMDLSRTGHSDVAADLISAIHAATEQYLDSATSTRLRNMTDQYKALSAYKTNQVSFNTQGKIATFSFQIDTNIGPADKPAAAMMLDNCIVNGKKAGIMFDTGAGANIISDSLAMAYDMIPLDVPVTVSGMGMASGHIAIAKEIRLGEITVTNVPFYVIPVKSGHEEADKYMKHLKLVIGSDIMLALKDLTIDFSSNTISVPTAAGERDGTPSNMCFSSGMNLLTKASVAGLPALMNIDTGDGSDGILSDMFYNRNKEFVTEAKGTPDSLRMAGIGGWSKLNGYKLTDIPLSLAGNTVSLPSIFVSEDHSMLSDNIDGNIGLATLLKFRKLRFDMVNMRLSTEPYPADLQGLNPDCLHTPAFDYIHKPEASPYQMVGALLFGIAKYMIYPYSPDNIDL